MKNRWLGDYCDLEINDNVLTKTFLRNFPDHILEKEWILKYNEFRSINSMPVEIYEVEKNKIHMEYIEGINMIEWVYKEGTAPSRLAHVSSKIFKLCSDMLEFSKERVFYHEDLNLTNYIVRNDEIVLVDPESFRFAPSINYNALVQPQINLSKVAHKIYEKTIFETNLW